MVALRGGVKGDTASILIPLIYAISDIEHRLEGERDSPDR